ncbi:alpha-hydroxy acid oxidase [Aliamphritea hakodatensis]|uniref:alpha-hydroxy acid oxidase n=1 Tax=Aliamphritea hakodatensis TaxID=2895352 RepID=UPI0022FD7715|nr:alpha-hydroxy acid oxidase [Aliamphritea hakodatensis]
MDNSKIIRKPLNGIPGEVLCASDYARLAPEYIPPDRLAYIAGGSGHDVTLDQNRRGFSDHAVVPSTLQYVSDGHTRIQLLNNTFIHPVLLAPTAYQTLVHPEGEAATARAAKATDTCIVASTLSSLSLEDIASHAGKARWFQLYLQPQFADTAELISRAVNAGYQAIVLTVDAAVQLPSFRAIRAGFRFPDDITAANLSAQAQAPAVTDTAQSSIFTEYMQNAATLSRISEVISQSPVPVLIKGILSPDDAVKVKALGASGAIVSNHGGRTLDGAPASLSVLPAIRDAVGSHYPLLLDSGIRSGMDAFKALALGADAVMVGRLPLYALSVAGALGVAHMLKLLREELELTMAMTGCTTVTDIRNTRLYPVNRR